MKGRSVYVFLRGRPLPRPPAALAPYQEEYSNEFRNCRLVPHLRHVPVDSGPLGASILQWQLAPSSWQGVGCSSSSALFSSTFALEAERGLDFLVVMITASGGSGDCDGRFSEKAYCPSGLRILSVNGSGTLANP